jgi:hypothetical protein
MDEKRKVQRQRTLKAGTISNSGAGSIDCVVKNLSETGASLEIESPIGITDDFTLVIINDDVKRSCRVAWRSARRIGVRFN